jgi:hypothetical protein
MKVAELWRQLVPGCASAEVVLPSLNAQVVTRLNEKVSAVSIIRQKLSTFSSVSEEGETASRGHPSAQFALRPRHTKHHPEGDAGWLQGTALLPDGCRDRRPRPLQNNVGLGFSHWFDGGFRRPVVSKSLL